MQDAVIWTGSIKPTTTNFKEQDHEASFPAIFGILRDLICANSRDTHAKTLGKQSHMTGCTATCRRPGHQSKPTTLFVGREICQWLKVLLQKPNSWTSGVSTSPSISLLPSTKGEATPNVRPSHHSRPRVPPSCAGSMRWVDRKCLSQACKKRGLSNKHIHLRHTRTAKTDPTIEIIYWCRS